MGKEKRFVYRFNIRGIVDFFGGIILILFIILVFISLLYDVDEKGINVYFEDNGSWIKSLSYKGDASSLDELAKSVPEIKNAYSDCNRENDCKIDLIDENLIFKNSKSIYVYNNDKLKKYDYPKGLLLKNESFEKDEIFFNDGILVTTSEKRIFFHTGNGWNITSIGDSNFFVGNKNHYYFLTKDRELVTFSERVKNSESKIFNKVEWAVRKLKGGTWHDLYKTDNNITNAIWQETDFFIAKDLDKFVYVPIDGTPVTSYTSTEIGLPNSELIPVNTSNLETLFLADGKLYRLNSGKWRVIKDKVNIPDSLLNGTKFFLKNNQLIVYDTFFLSEHYGAIVLIIGFLTIVCLLKNLYVNYLAKKVLRDFTTRHGNSVPLPKSFVRRKSRCFREFLLFFSWFILLVIINAIPVNDLYKALLTSSFLLITFKCLINYCKRASSQKTEQLKMRLRISENIFIIGLISVLCCICFSLNGDSSCPLIDFNDVGLIILLNFYACSVCLYLLSPFFDKDNLFENDITDHLVPNGMCYLLILHPCLLVIFFIIMAELRVNLCYASLFAYLLILLSYTPLIDIIKTHSTPINKYTKVLLSFFVVLLLTLYCIYLIYNKGNEWSWGEMAFINIPLCFSYMGAVTCLNKLAPITEKNAIRGIIPSEYLKDINYEKVLERISDYDSAIAFSYLAEKYDLSLAILLSSIRDSKKISSPFLLLNWLFIILIRLNKLDEAKELLKKHYLLLDSEPKFLFYIQQKDYKEALKCLNNPFGYQSISSVLKQNIFYIRLNAYLALAYAGCGKMKLSQKAFKKANFIGQGIHHQRFLDEIKLEIDKL